MRAWVFLPLLLVFMPGCAHERKAESRDPAPWMAWDLGPPTPGNPSIETYEDWIESIRRELPDAAHPENQRPPREWFVSAIDLVREVLKEDMARQGLPEPLESKLRTFLDEVPHPENDLLSKAEDSTWLVPRLSLLYEEFNKGAWPRDEASIREWILKLIGTVKAYAQDLPRPESADKLLDTFAATLDAFPSPCSLSALGTKEQSNWLDRRLARLSESLPEARQCRRTELWLHYMEEVLRKFLLQARQEQLVRIGGEIVMLERLIPLKQGNAGTTEAQEAQHKQAELNQPQTSPTDLSEARTHADSGLRAAGKGDFETALSELMAARMALPALPPAARKWSGKKPDEPKGPRLEGLYGRSEGQDQDTYTFKKNGQYDHEKISGTDRTRQQRCDSGHYEINEKTLVLRVFSFWDEYEGGGGGTGGNFELQVHRYDFEDLGDEKLRIDGKEYKLRKE